MDDNDDAGDSGNEQVEREARSLGWVPKEQFRGPPEQWRDADEFVRRGREILPIVTANNRRLVDELTNARKQIADLRGTVDAQSKAVKDILEHQASEIKRQVESKIAALRAEKKEALRSGDLERASDLEEEIDTTKDALEQANKAKTAPAAAPSPNAPPPIPPWAQEFGEQNKDWLGPDKKKTALFMGICEELFEEGVLKGTDLLNEGKKRAEEILSPKGRQAPKSEGGQGGWNGSSRPSGGARDGKSYADLPPDAKAVCDSQAKKFVGEGPGKLFKTEKGWRDYYAKTHFESQV